METPLTPLEFERRARKLRAGVRVVNGGGFAEPQSHPLRLDLGLELLGQQRKEFAKGKGPLRAERAGASESLDRGEVSNPCF